MLVQFLSKWTAPFQQNRIIGPSCLLHIGCSQATHEIPFLCNTLLPEASVRSLSEGTSGLWSCVRATLSFLFDSFHFILRGVSESLKCAMYSFFPCMITMATVVPVACKSRRLFSHWGSSLEKVSAFAGYCSHSTRETMVCLGPLV